MKPTHRKNALLATLIFVLLATALVALPATATPLPGNRDRDLVVFYQNINYTGVGVHAYESQTYATLPVDLRNQASSVDSYSDKTVCFYDGPNYTGASYCLAPLGAIPDLRTVGLNDKIESIKFVSTGNKLNLLDYFLTSGTTRNVMEQNREVFYTLRRAITRAKVRNGANAFTIIKNTAGTVYEEFTYDANYIYHLRDTSWDKKCGTDDALFTLKLDTLEGAAWVPRAMSVGETTPSLGREIIGINRRTCTICSNQYTGPTSHRVKLVSRGAVNWRSGTQTFTHADVIRLAVVDGAGKGDNFWFARGLGWIGFQHFAEPASPESPISADGPTQRIRYSESGTLPLNEVCPNCSIP